MFVHKVSAGNQRKTCNTAHGAEGKQFRNFEGVRDPEDKGQNRGQIQIMGLIMKNASTPITTQFFTF